MRMFKRLEAAQHFGKRPDRWEILFPTYIYPVWPGLKSIKKLLSNHIANIVQLKLTQWTHCTDDVGLVFRHSKELTRQKHMFRVMTYSMETCLMVQSKANFMEVTLLFNNGGLMIIIIVMIVIGIDYCIIFSCRWQMRMFKREPEMNQEYQGSPLRSWWSSSYQMFILVYIIRKCQIYRFFEQHTVNIFVFVRVCTIEDFILDVTYYVGNSRSWSLMR